jgi:ribosomal protein S18 acetylase RimI-like enzyme
MLLRDYSDEMDRTQIITLFDEFQDYIAALDPLHRVRRLPGYGAQALRETLAEIAAHEGKFCVAVENDAVIGFGVGIVIRPTPDEHLSLIESSRGRITQLYVVEPYRGKGIARQLIQHLESYLAAKGCDVVLIEVFAPNHAARQFYEASDYQERDIHVVRRISGRNE